MLSREAAEFEFFLEILKDLPAPLVERMQNTTTWEEYESLEDEIFNVLQTYRDATNAMAETALFIKVSKTVPMFLNHFHPENDPKPVVVARRQSLEIEPISSQELDDSSTQQEDATHIKVGCTQVHKLDLRGKKDKERRAFDNLKLHNVQVGRTGMRKDERARQPSEPQKRATFFNVLAFYKSLPQPKSDPENPAQKHLRPW